MSSQSRSKKQRPQLQQQPQDAAETAEQIHQLVSTLAAMAGAGAPTSPASSTSPRLTGMRQRSTGTSGTSSELNSAEGTPEADATAATAAGAGAEAEEQGSRPKLYPHAPAARQDELERNRFDEMELLDALRIRSFEGFYNLAFLMLLFSLTYNYVRNIRENGLAISLDDFRCETAMRDVVTSSKVVAGAAAFSLFSFVLHKLHSVHKLLSTPAFLVCYCLCQALQLLVPSLVVFASRMAPLFAAVTEMQLVVLAMKAHSYFATNYALLRERGFKRPLGHITLGDYLYYLLAPTLVYEPRFPRTAAIRPRYVGKKLAQAAVAMLAQYCTMAQFMLPVLRRPSGGALYDMMKLAVPSFIVWLLGFYALFHCLLNAIAELLRFADRQFYLDWWNTTSLDSFWRKWNTPVHEWCLRHVYVESMHYYKVSKTTATTGVFLMSALLHEVIIFVGFRTLRPWFFVGMIVQLPLILLSRYFRGHRRGNYIVWWSLFMGHPLLEILYIREWYTHHDSLYCTP